MRFTRVSCRWRFSKRHQTKKQPSSGSHNRRKPSANANSSYNGVTQKLIIANLLALRLSFTDMKSKSGFHHRNRHGAGTCPLEFECRKTVASRTRAQRKAILRTFAAIKRVFEPSLLLQRRNFAFSCHKTMQYRFFSPPGSAGPKPLGIFRGNRSLHSHTASPKSA